MSHAWSLGRDVGRSPNAWIATLCVACLCIAGAQSACYVDNSPGFVMPTTTNELNQVVCPVGFHCPHFDTANASTYPVYCQPTAQCQVLRMQGKLCDGSMGTFEPFVCPLGKYCPDATTVLTCPSKHYCRLGQSAPLPCPGLSLCGEGATGPMNFLGVTCFVVAAIFFATVSQVYQRKLRPSAIAPNYHTMDHSPVNALDGTSPNGAGPPPCRSTRDVLAASFCKARGAAKPLKITFTNLSVSLCDDQKVLVAAVSGSLRPGTVTAILGPSGAGKTVLLKALLGRTDPNWAVGGSLTVNGDAHVGKYRSMIGSVPQDDVLHTELTVYRNVRYSALLRLPREWPDEEQADLIKAVLESLGLAGVADVPIGDAEARGVSGGQRKRASIGVELVTAPQALLLDEPTKGLDSNTALELVNTLRRIALETEVTVAMVINQPRTEIWNALDELLILAPGGRTVYQGRREDVAAYMTETFGLAFPPESNPADVVLDAVSARGNDMADTWAERTEIKLSSGASDQGTDSREEIPWNGASLLAQVRIAHIRYLEKQLNTLGTLYIETAVSCFLGLVLGFSLRQFDMVGYFKFPFELISPIPLSALSSQMHMYSFFSLGLATATAGVNVFVNDKATYTRAVACGSSRVAHYIGTVTASWYRLVLVTLAFTAPYHLLSLSAAPFGLYFLMFLLFAWVMYAVAGIVAILADQRSAALISGVTALLYACFSGFIDFPVGLKRLSFCFWAAQVLQEWLFYDTRHVFAENSSEWGWSLGERSASFSVIFCMGIAYHVIACCLLVAHARQ